MSGNRPPPDEGVLFSAVGYVPRELKYIEPPRMTLEQWYAGMALPLAVQAMRDTPPSSPNLTVGQHLAEIAFAIAGRMVAESEKTK